MKQKIYTLVALGIMFSNNVLAAMKTVGTDGLSGGEVKLPNPLGDINTFQALISKIITGALGIVGSLTLLMFVYGGFLWLTSAGDGKKIEQGKNILLWSTVGLAIIFSSYALVKFVITSIGG